MDSLLSLSYTATHIIIESFWKKNVDLAILNIFPPKKNFRRIIKKTKFGIFYKNMLFLFPIFILYMYTHTYIHRHGYFYWPFCCLFLCG